MRGYNAQQPPDRNDDLDELLQICPVKEMVVSRVIRPDGSDELVNEQTTFSNGDIIRVLTDKQHLTALRFWDN